MSEHTTKPVDEPAEASTPVPAPGSAVEAEANVEADLLVEDVSIDGMCGVY
jgi:mycofactocin precursor